MESIRRESFPGLKEVCRFRLPIGYFSKKGGGVHMRILRRAVSNLVPVVLKRAFLEMGKGGRSFFIKKGILKNLRGGWELY